MINGIIANAEVLEEEYILGLREENRKILAELTVRSASAFVVIGLSDSVPSW
jgi:hypothetical protein